PAALGRPEEARRLLEETPAAWRGIAWSVTYAWVARLAGEPVAAARALARVPEDVAERLRASGEEPLARLAAQAWAP
ncbi:MAG: hypothetical protein D6718_07160, partial [Acidobacteria bacterium]